MRKSFLAIYGIKPDTRTPDTPAGTTEANKPRHPISCLLLLLLRELADTVKGPMNRLLGDFAKLFAPGTGWSLPARASPSLIHLPTNSTSSFSSTKGKAEATSLPPAIDVPIELQNRHRIDLVNNSVGNDYVYQIPIPPKQISEFRITTQRYHNGVYGGLRMLKHVGLREWEWSCGEPFYDDTGADADDGDFKEAIESDTSEEDKDLVKMSYRKRVEAFTYTRADDPICKSRKIEVCVPRQNIVIWSEPDYGDEVDEPEYVPPSVEKFRKRKVRPIKSRTSGL